MEQKPKPATTVALNKRLNNALDSIGAIFASLKDSKRETESEMIIKPHTIKERVTTLTEPYTPKFSPTKKRNEDVSKGFTSPLASKIESRSFKIEIETLTSEISRLKAELEISTDKLRKFQEYKTEVERLRVGNDILKKKLQSAIEASDLERESMMEVELSVSLERNRVANMENKVEEISKENSELVQQRSELKSRNEMMRTDLAKKDQNRKSLLKKLEVSHQKHIQSEATIRQLKAEIGQLKSKNRLLVRKLSTSSEPIVPEIPESGHFSTSQLKVPNSPLSVAIASIPSSSSKLSTSNLKSPKSNIKQNNKRSSTLSKLPIPMASSPINRNLEASPKEPGSPTSPIPALKSNTPDRKRTSPMRRKAFLSASGIHNNKMNNLPQDISPVLSPNRRNNSLSHSAQKDRILSSKNGGSMKIRPKTERPARRSAGAPLSEQKTLSLSPGDAGIVDPVELPGNMTSDPEVIVQSPVILTKMTKDNENSNNMENEIELLDLDTSLGEIEEEVDNKKNETNIKDTETQDETHFKTSTTETKTSLEDDLGSLMAALRNNNINNSNNITNEITNNNNNLQSINLLKTAFQSENAGSQEAPVNKPPTPTETGTIDENVDFLKGNIVSGMEIIESENQDMNEPNEKEFGGFTPYPSPLMHARDPSANMEGLFGSGNVENGKVDEGLVQAMRMMNMERIELDDENEDNKNLQIEEKHASITINCSPINSIDETSASHGSSILNELSNAIQVCGKAALGHFEEAPSPKLSHHQNNIKSRLTPKQQKQYDQLILLQKKEKTRRSQRLNSPSRPRSSRKQRIQPHTPLVSNTPQTHSQLPNFPTPDELASKQEQPQIPNSMIERTEVPLRKRNNATPPRLDQEVSWTDKSEIKDINEPENRRTSIEVVDMTHCEVLDCTIDDEDNNMNGVNANDETFTSGETSPVNSPSFSLESFRSMVERSSPPLQPSTSQIPELPVRNTTPMNAGHLVSPTEMVQNEPVEYQPQIHNLHNSSMGFVENSPKNKNKGDLIVIPSDQRVNLARAKEIEMKSNDFLKTRMEKVAAERKRLAKKQQMDDLVQSVVHGKESSNNRKSTLNIPRNRSISQPRPTKSSSAEPRSSSVKRTTAKTPSMKRKNRIPDTSLQRGSPFKLSSAADNGKIVDIALSRVVLIGGQQKKALADAREAMLSGAGHQFLIAFKSNHPLRFGGLYEVLPEVQKITRVIGIGPRQLSSKDIETWLKFDSGSKSFKEISVGFSPSLSGVVFNPMSFRRKATPSKMKPNFGK
eukprot:TRINITY_DN773983_c0_g1_i1.p1 TRINITY_DN773983_c0_g1~~TRINITY_DN773983_c0_g1_i1.p1  ORF type:complete len:1271 (-),score=373.86 TRINITY_DN773983_c0_g1_i1:348-4160(-)